MNIKILETKLQTIFENDLFAVTEENIKERILIELDFILQRIAEYYETIEMIATIKLGAREHIKDEKYDLENLGEIIIKCDNILDMLENESIYYKEKLINFTEEIDHHTTEKIRRRADYEIERYVPRKVIFDFNKVSFMDSAGIGLLIGRYKNARAIGAKVELKNVNKSIYKILKMSGITRLIPIKEEECV